MLQSLGGLLNGDGRAAQIVVGVVVLAVLVGLLYVLYRLLFAHRLRAPNGTRARGSRLGIVDVYGLDGQRQLVIVRRDNVEHLLMIGGPNDVVVEGNIVRATTNGAVREAAKPAAAGPPPQSEPAAEPPPAPFPRPVAPSAVSNVMKRAFSQRTEPSLAPAAEPAAVRPEEPIVPESRAKTEPARQPEPARAGNNTVIPLPRAPAEPAPKAANETKPAPTPAPVESPPAAKVAPEPPPRRAAPPKAAEPPPRPALPSPIAPMRPRSAPAADTARPNPTPPPADPPPKPPEAVAPPPAPVAPASVSTVAADAASAEKPAQRKEEAFYDLESLEAEMARLLGRDG